MTEPPQTRSIVVLDPSQITAARELAEAHGVEVELVPRLGIEPVTTVTLVLVGSAVAVGALQHVLEQRKGGQVIDLRPGAPKAFYRTTDLVYGLVLIIAVDGAVTVKVKEPSGMFGKVISTLPQLLSGADEGTERVATAVAEAFGPQVEIETVESRTAGGGA